MNNLINLGVLAQLGDAVHYLKTIEANLYKVSDSSELHKKVSEIVSAQSQANLLDFIKPQLSEIETDIVRRARNIKLTRRTKIKQSIYRLATSFEVLIGYLHLNDLPRLDYIIKLCQEYDDNLPKIK